MSSTGPMTWTTLPTLCFASSAGCFGACFAFVARAYPLRLCRPGWGDGEDAKCGGRRGHRTLELREHHFHRVQRARFELRHERAHDLGRVRGRRLVTDVGALRRRRPLRELEVGDPLLPDQVQVDPGALALELLDAPPRLADQIGVERAAQPP